MNVAASKINQVMRGNSDRRISQDGPGDGIIGQDLLTAIRNILGEYVPEYATAKVVEESCKLLGCDRATLFTMDPSGEFLTVKVGKGKAPPMIGLGRGIAGTVAKTAEALVVDDAQTHPMFDVSNDKRTGYHTRNMIVLPALDTSNHVVGVLQAINKLPEGTAFTEHDLVMAATLCTVGSLCLRSCVTMETLKRKEKQSTALVDLMRVVADKMDNSSSFMFTVNRRAKELLFAKISHFWVVDEKAGTLWCSASEDGSQRKRPLEGGITGECLAQKKMVLINDAGADERTGQDAHLPLPASEVTSIICMPIMSNKGDKEQPKAVVAVLELVNKDPLEGTEFDAEDAEFLRQLCGLVGSKIENNMLMDGFSQHRRSITGTEANEALMTFNSPKPRRRSITSGIMEEELIEEGEEGEEEED